MRLDLARYFSKRELGHILDLSYASINCQDTDNLIEIIRDLEKLFFLETILYCSGNVGGMFEDNPTADILDISCPSGFVDMYLENQFHQTDASIWEFLGTMQPVNWLSIDCKTMKIYPETVCAPDFGMYDGWTHGVLNLASMHLSLFFIGNTSKEGNPRTAKVLEYIVPFFVEAHRRIKTLQPVSENILTQREKEVLNWIKEGKGSWDIAVILNCSKRVIDFHVSNMKQKLDVVNRPQLVAKAIRQKLIDF